MIKPKILVILGPTASGKSDLAVELAKKFNGEVISADSRQVYRGLNIGSGKITKKEMRGVPHHLLDVANPKSRFTVEKFKKLADTAIKDVLKKEKLPIICGGTGFYIQAVIDNIALPEVPPNPKLRAKLEKKIPEALCKILQKLDPKRAAVIDPKNKRRLIRSIEIATHVGNVPQAISSPIYEVLQIGLTTDDTVLKKKIEKRIVDRIKKGMITEARKLHQQGLSWKRMEELGLEYRYLAKYLKSELPKAEMIQKLNFESWQYARRQKTWFRRDKRIKWFELKDKGKIEKEVKRFFV